MTNINNIISQSKRKFAVPNRYKVEINLPLGAFGLLSNSGLDYSIDDFVSKSQIKGVPRQLLDSVQSFVNIPNARDFINLGVNSAGISTAGLTMMCETAQLPGMVLAQTEQRTYGPTKRRPNSPVFLEMPLGFYCSEDHRERMFFDLWFSMMVNRESHDMNFYDDYKTNIMVSQLDGKGNATYKVKLIDAFPLNMTAIELGYANTNTIEKFTVSFSYHEWKPIVLDPLDGLQENLGRIDALGNIIT